MERVWQCIFLLAIWLRIVKHGGMKLLLAMLLLIHASVSMSQIRPTPPHQAFQLSVAARDYQTVLLKWKIAPGYSLYRNQFRFTMIAPKDGQLSQALMPVGTTKTTAHQKAYWVYQDTVIIPIPIIRPQDQAIILRVTYQGCSDEGYCYPPITKRVSIDLTKNYQQFTTSNIKEIQTHQAAPLRERKHPSMKHLLQGKSLLTFLFGFLGFGLLIAFTPCVLPMIPILSAIITGHGKMTTSRAVRLSACYVLGMALSYALAGVITGSIGSNLQVAFQTPWAVVLFSLVFVIMALSLFGLFHIELPEKWRALIAQTSQGQPRNSYLGALLMGILSTLILSPCVTPPLVGVLSFIGQTGHAIIGGIALFVMGIGMGLPLILVGFSHGKCLPTSGPWMNTIQHWLGILMLATALWMLQRIFNDAVMMWLWASLCIGIAIYLVLSCKATGFTLVKKGVGLVIFSYGALLIINATTRHTNPLQPFSFLHQEAQPSHRFIPVKTLSDVHQQLAAADRKNQIVLLDFYADWCIACKEMDRFTFSDRAVQQQLKHFIVLRADVTHNDVKDKKLQKHFKVIAPPTLIFFKDGHEIKYSRIVGAKSAEAFSRHLTTIHPPAPTD